MFGRKTEGWRSAVGWFGLPEVLRGTDVEANGVIPCKLFTGLLPIVGLELSFAAEEMPFSSRDGLRT